MSFGIGKKMADLVVDEILSIVNKADLSETGGGHNQKGVDFQRYWTIHRMIELEKSGAEDFLILIEAIQDVAELDSCTSPTSILLYQVKKKDRKEWTWNKLTNLKVPYKKPETSENIFKDSPLGKLFVSVIAFEKLNARGKFISNSGCDIPLADGGNAATSIIASLENLPHDYKQLLEVKMFEISDKAKSALPNIFLEKVVIPPDDPRTHIIGFTHEFLKSRSARHAGQASSFVDALMAIIGPLGTRTNTCNSFEDLCCLHGFSRSQFINALGDLETVPDLLAHLESWLFQLGNEGMGILEITSIRAEAAAIFRDQLIGVANANDAEKELIQDCDHFLDENEIQNELKPIFELAFEKMKTKHKLFKKNRILAQVAIRAISRCVDRI